MERMKRQSGGSSKAPQSSPVPGKNSPTMTNSVAQQAPAQPQVSHEDRMAELRRKSEISRQNAKAKVKANSEPVVEPVEAEPVTVTEPVLVSVESTTATAMVTPVASKVDESAAKNVFKNVDVTVVKTSSDRRRKRRRHDKKGGGRQKQEKKLNRQKYLEYKYAAKDILDNPNIPEEHRSNILGQVWAKGERMGVADSMEFIDQKVLEEILPEDVAQRIRDLVNKMTTRR